MEEIHIGDLMYSKSNSKTMTIFSDLSNEFQVLDYSPTHNQLLIRSMKSRKRDYNIDIIVKGVTTMLISSILKGLEISLADNDDSIEYLIKDFGFKKTKDYRIFLLKGSDGNSFFLNAMALGVYHNKLDILETSIGRYDMGDFGENILWYAD